MLDVGCWMLALPSTPEKPQITQINADGLLIRAAAAAVISGSDRIQRQHQ
jgi:hypothetical protein